MSSNRQIRYVGSSMHPLLLQDDVLEWVPVSERLPVPGDIIVFEDPEGSGHLIIHRIVTANPDRSYRTRGDNTLHDDAHPIPLSAVKGVVTGGFREERPMSIPTGSTGMKYHRYAQQRMKVMSGLQGIFSRPYLYVSRHKIFCRILPNQYRQRLVLVSTNEGYDLQVYLGSRLVGWKGENDGRWTIMPPFRLFIDDTGLPESPADVLSKL